MGGGRVIRGLLDDRREVFHREALRPFYLCGVEGGMSGRTPSARGEVKSAPLLHFHTARVFFMPEGS